MFYVLLALIALGVWLFCLFDVLTTDETDVRYLPKFAWFLIVLLGWCFGAILWQAFGRPRRPSEMGVQYWSSVPQDAERDLPRGPDDDPEFLRNLDRKIRGDD